MGLSKGNVFMKQSGCEFAEFLLVIFSVGGLGKLLGGKALMINNTNLDIIVKRYVVANILFRLAV